MSDLKITGMGTRELWEAYQKDPIGLYATEAQRMLDAGIEDKPTVSRALEQLSPTEGNGPDAFERLMMTAEIRTQSDPAAGYWASHASAFTRNAGTKALLGEFFARNWRKISMPNERAILLSNTGTAGSFERPYADAMMVRPSQEVEAAIPLSELVAITTPIDSDSYRSYYMTYNAEQLRAFRVGESADIPIATIAGSEHTIRLKKYGRGLRASYEELRRMRVDKLAYHIQWMAVQSEVDKVAAALTVLINGDGNSGTAATTHDLTDLDAAASAGTLSLKGWLSYKMKFAQPYRVTTVLLQEAVALQLALLNTGSANIPLSGANLGSLGTGLTPINQFADGVRYGWTSEAPALKIVGFDNRRALERVTEIGSEIAEMERYITNQTQVMVMSEVEGYAILDANATRILDVNA